MRVGDVVMLTPSRDGYFPFSKDMVGEIGLVIGCPSHYNQWWVVFGCIPFKDFYIWGTCVPFKNLYILDHIVQKSVLKHAERHIKYEAELTALHLKRMRKCLRDIKKELHGSL